MVQEIKPTLHTNQPGETEVDAGADAAWDPLRTNSKVDISFWGRRGNG